MSPNEYIQARKDPTTDFVVIDGRPYWPFLKADKTSLESIKEVAAKIILFSDTTSTNANANANSNGVIDDCDDDWKNKLKVGPITGGNTNVLFCVSGWKEILLLRQQQEEENDNNNNNNIGCFNSILVRVFGSEGIIDRDVENSTYASLDRQHLVPTYYGRFANGRLEQFLDDMRPLRDEELSLQHISTQIAQQMAHLHVSGGRSNNNDDDSDNNVNAPEEPQEPRLWKEIGQWMKHALAIKSFKIPTDMDRCKELIPTLSTSTSTPRLSLSNEIEWLQEDVVPRDSRICFCHNDILASNIMYCERTQQIQLIDFEYGGTNFAAFDIANHFNEFAGGTDNGGTPNYANFPTLEFQRQFISSYLQAFHRYSNNNHNNDNKRSQKRQEEEEEEEGDEAAKARVVDWEIDNLHTQVKAFILVDHLYWGLWGIHQAATEGTQDGFDYLLYGSHRINEYYRQKKALLT